MSVVVATYNQAPYIAQALDSVLSQQTSFPVEICVGEDGSTDGTREICLDYAARFPDRVRVFLRDRKDVIYINGAPSARFNFLETLRACRGTYLALLDGDDYWTDPGKLQKQTEYLQAHPRCNLVAHRTRVMRRDGSEAIVAEGLSSASDREGEFTLRDFLAAGYMFHTSSMVARNTFFAHPLPPFAWKSGPGDQLFVCIVVGPKGTIKILEDLASVSRRLATGMSGTQRSQPRRVFYLSRLRFLFDINRHFRYRYSGAVVRRALKLATRWLRGR